MADCWITTVPDQLLFNGVKGSREMMTDKITHNSLSNNSKHMTF